MRELNRYPKNRESFDLGKQRPFPRTKEQEYSDLAKYPPAEMSQEEWCKWLARELNI